ncbi:MAG: energy-coupling factor transporter transmembrane component T family protein [Nitrospinales bacterium]
MKHPGRFSNSSLDFQNENPQGSLDSPLHRIKPLPKTTFFLLMIIAVALGNAMILGSIGLMCLVGIWISGLPLGRVLNNIRAFLGFIFVVTLFPVFFSPGTPLPSMENLPITQEGLNQGIFSGTRVLLMFLLAQIMMATTPAMTFVGGEKDLFDGPIWHRLHLKKVATITLISVQLIPIIYEESREWFLARLAGEEGRFQQSLLGKAQAIAILLVPLMANILKNTDRYSRKLEELSGDGIMEGRVTENA